MEQLEISHQRMHTYFKKQIIVDRKVLKLQRNSSATLLKISLSLVKPAFRTALPSVSLLL